MLFFSFLTAYLLFANEPLKNDVFASRSVGHLLSSNNHVLQKNEWGLGTMYAGYGLTEQWTIATSPFVLFDFTMLNFQTRYAWSLNQKSRLGFDFAYYKSLNDKKSEYYDFCARIGDPIEQCITNVERTIGYKKFRMEAWSVKTTYSQFITDFYRASSTLTYFYYLDSTRPFSFRMDPANKDKFAISLTTLHEFKVSQNGYLNLEAGFWGLNYQHPYYHAGLTYNYQLTRWTLSAGFSSTFNFDFPKEKVRKFVYYDSRYSIHPELQIQTFF
ncbi:hypothetical protein K2X05_07965 [bacterium]|nr:hypothetical protein [bacterium]